VRPTYGSSLRGMNRDARKVGASFEKPTASWWLKFRKRPPSSRLLPRATPFESRRTLLLMSSVSAAATITCPLCGHQTSETMPTDACQFFYECTSCGAMLRPREGDCCVFCSYGDRRCPPRQLQAV
jgi:hypothetical protein